MEHYSSLNVARDVLTVLDRLSYDNFGYYGFSFGTIVGQHLLQDSPQRIDFMILDGVVPLEPNPFALEAVHMQRNLVALFASCCDAQLRDSFFDRMDMLDEMPLTISLEDGDSSYDYLVTSADIYTLLRDVLQTPEALNLFPIASRLIVNGDNSLLTTLIREEASPLSSQQTRSLLPYAVFCPLYFADFGGITREADTEPSVVNWATGMVGQFEAICEELNLPSLPTEAQRPPQSDVPVLLLTGEFDPATPATNLTFIAEHLSNAKRAIIPGLGHGTLLNGTYACSREVLRAFLQAPEVDLDIDCVA